MIKLAMKVEYHKMWIDKGIELRQVITVHLGPSTSDTSLLI